jgi:benzodiazapine receptor
MHNSKTVNILKFLVSIVICQLAGYVGSIFTTPEIGIWYAALEKPFFSPPNWVFAPVWTTLFLLMGISLYLIWEKQVLNEGRGFAISIFIFQLALNILWSLLFFGFHSPLAAFIEIIALWIMILFTIEDFSKISKLSAWLLLPYILWVSFAGVLNFFIWWLN